MRILMPAALCLFAAGCTPGPERVFVPADPGTRVMTESEKEMQEKVWTGFQANAGDVTDRLVSGTVTKVGENYKWVTIKVDDAKAIVNPGDIFLVYYRRDDFDKQGFHAEYEHKDYLSARARATKIDKPEAKVEDPAKPAPPAGPFTVTAEIVDYDAAHPVSVGDKAIARTF
jgi:hypothetical protein